MFSNYMDDYFVYDSKNNLMRNRTTKEGFIQHWAPVDCNLKYKKYSRKWQECKCINAVGGDMAAAELVKLYKQGVPLDVLKIRYGLRSAHCIYVILSMYGIKAQRNPHKKKRKRLSEEELEQIKKLYKQGASIYEIAKRLDRPVSTIAYTLKKLRLK